MRAAVWQRDATLISVLAYGGLRPGEALGLRWGDVRERTLLIERAVSLGEVGDTKTRAHRTVRMLTPLAQDLREWRLASGRPDDRALVFPGRDGKPWTQPAYQSWRRRAFKRALTAAGVEHARVYSLRHSFASLLLHEGRREHYVARQLGHDPRLTVSTYGHVIDEFEDSWALDAEAAIKARSRVRWYAICTCGAIGGTELTPRRPAPKRGGLQANHGLMELGGLEPPTSWVRSRRSPN